MVGNKISRLNVYGADWHLDGILRMKPGQIDLYTQTVKVMTEDGMQEHDVKILVEQCKGEGIMSKMAFGSGANQIITNEYRRFEQPTIKADFAEQCDCIYTMYMMYKELTFKLQFLRISETEYIWYVKPGKNGLKLEDLTDQRVITDVVDYNPLHTRMQTVSPKEKRVFEYFGRQKVFYSDDQTGTDFKQCYRALL